MAAAQFAGIGIEHFEILEMVSAHGGLHDPAVAWIEMSYADLPASMGEADCANPACRKNFLASYITP
jgi:hypothetical protein